MGRPDYVHCIKHWHHDKRNHSWCGEWITGQFHLVDLNHAAGLHETGSRLQACPKCVKLALEQLQLSAATP